VRISRFVFVPLMLLSIVASAREPAGPVWRDTALERTQVLALLQTLNANLLSQSSATQTLQQWCDAHHLAQEAKIVAHRVTGEDKPLSADDRALLGIGPDEAVRYRHVRLACGDWVLSDADNWYVPSRLTPEMNYQLDHSDVPFGTVVKPLNFRRQTLSAGLLWSPLPKGWETDAKVPPPSGKPMAVAPYVLQHRAVLFRQDQQPFSLVVETYTADVLAFGPRTAGH
jgi:hypothetical protein